MLDPKFLEFLDKKYGIKFNNKKLVQRAMTHSSFDNEHKGLGIGDYERLEFLGDAVLEINISRYLFEKYPELPEGKLTCLRSDIVRTDSFARFAKEIQIDKYLLIGKGEEKFIYRSFGKEKWMGDEVAASEILRKMKEEE